MSLVASKTRLLAITRELGHHWEHARDYWKDAKAEEFDQKYMKELFNSVQNAVEVIEELDKLVSKVRKDCE
jgi:hypothetical protein